MELSTTLAEDILDRAEIGCRAGESALWDGEPVSENVAVVYAHEVFTMRGSNHDGYLSMRLAEFLYRMRRTPCTSCGLATSGYAASYQKQGHQLAVTVKVFGTAPVNLLAGKALDRGVAIAV